MSKRVLALEIVAFVLGTFSLLLLTWISVGSIWGLDIRLEVGLATVALIITLIIIWRWLTRTWRPVG